MPGNRVDFLRNIDRRVGERARGTRRGARRARGPVVGANPPVRQAQGVQQAPYQQQAPNAGPMYAPAHMLDGAPPGVPNLAGSLVNMYRPRPFPTEPIGPAGPALGFQSQAPGPTPSRGFAAQGPY